MANNRRVSWYSPPPREVGRLEPGPSAKKEAVHEAGALVSW